MTSSFTKTTQTSITWRKALFGDEGSQFAVMTGRFNQDNPLGSTEFIVFDAEGFCANKEAAQEAYSDFCEEFSSMVGGTTALVTEASE